MAVKTAFSGGKYSSFSGGKESFGGGKTSLSGAWYSSTRPPLILVGRLCQPVYKYSDIVVLFNNNYVMCRKPQ